ncbi:hypothetical protein QC764_607310 [Podospora pseudoanserina]|uniref:Cytochrome P450 E-class, group I n=1 Tax=Podospora pseudoanserina TaxID=2609844 RepID=A0ABR0HUA6_9PEZI|nr:hypothetical protein QC764_607310 [Podospora pseudoanserina]
MNRNDIEMPYPIYYYVAILSIAALFTRSLYVRISLFQRKRRFARKHGCAPVTRVRAWDPLLGLDHFVRLGKAAAQRQYLEYWRKNMFGRYGNTFEINLMGQRLLFTNEPRNIQAVLVTQFPDFDIGQRRRDNSAQLLGVGVFNADGPTWEHARATLRPNLTRAQVADLQLFEKHVGVWMAALPKDGQAVDMQEWAFRFTLDVGTEFLLGTSSGVLDPQATALGRRFAWAFNLGVDGVAQKIRLGSLAPLYYNADYGKACKMVHEYVDPIVLAAIEATQKTGSEQHSNVGDEKRYTFLAALASEGISPKKIRDHVLNILIAARDTSACLMSAAFFELARQPAIQAKLRAEVDRQLEGRLPRYDDLKDMTYLNWFIKEALRLYPPIPMNIRVANKDTILPVGGGPDGSAPIFVPAGQEVVYQIFSTHRRRDLWGEDADQFRPERWETIRPHFQYLPFNGGPRICPGQQFALLETSFVLVRFLQEYSRLEAPATSQQPWTENYTLTCSVGQGSWVKLTKRGGEKGSEVSA